MGSTSFEDACSPACSVGEAPSSTFVFVNASRENDAVPVEPVSLKTPADVTASADGKDVYVVASSDSDDHTLSAFSRDSVSGALALTSVITDGGNSYGRTVDGLSGANCVTHSPDGKHVYVTADRYDNGSTKTGAVSFYSRDLLDGALSFVGVIRNGDSNGNRTVNGLDGARSLAVTPDGRHVYVVAYSRGKDAVSLFSRDTSSGVL
eukprot:scaffold1465_cov148-Pinguiococcus_pyrenoidosus.AAC.1